MPALPLRDPLPSGIYTALDSLIFQHPDAFPNDPMRPVDPYLPPNPIFPTAVQLPILDFIFDLEGVDLGDSLPLNGDLLV
jgi:hypothetical protein